MAEPIYEIAAKPTIYKGIIFRSRLEARWAAFFDQLGWHWNYEPFDLHGWSPDFVLGYKQLLVEVKPFDFLALEETREKMRRAAPRANLLLISDSPFKRSCEGYNYEYQTLIGWVSSPHINQGIWGDGLLGEQHIVPPGRVEWGLGYHFEPKYDEARRVSRLHMNWMDAEHMEDSWTHRHKHEAMWSEACNATRFEVNQ